MLVEDTHRIAVPLRNPASVNAWLLTGKPVTLVDTGPRSDTAVGALELELATHGCRIEDLELVLVTHHHHDHEGLAAEIRRRSGATVAAHERVAEYCRRIEPQIARERAYGRRVMAAHGVPQDSIDAHDGFWTRLSEGGESFVADRRLADGERIVAGGRTLEVVFRPGHSSTDTLFLDAERREAFVGDHLLSDVSSNTEMYPSDHARGRPHMRVEYLANLRKTARMGLDRLFPGHGPVIGDHVGLIASRLAEHAERCERLAAELAGGPRTAYELAARLWSAATVGDQPLLVVWEVLGHLDLLAADGAVTETVDPDGVHRFRRTGAPKHSFSSPVRSHHRAPIRADVGCF